ncbi:hypothetical protein AGIG_G18170 [Arapaima gigas]
MASPPGVLLASLSPGDKYSGRTQQDLFKTTSCSSSEAHVLSQSFFSRGVRACEGTPTRVSALELGTDVRTGAARQHSGSCAWAAAAGQRHPCGRIRF